MPASIQITSQSGGDSTVSLMFTVSGTFGRGGNPGEARVFCECIYQLGNNEKNVDKDASIDPAAGTWEAHFDLTGEAPTNPSMVIRATLFDGNGELAAGPFTRAATFSAG